MARRDYHCPWDRCFNGFSETRERGYLCVYMRFEHPARWVRVAVLLDNEGVLWIYHVHCGVNCSSVGDIWPSLVG